MSDIVHRELEQMLIVRTSPPASAVQKQQTTGLKENGYVHGVQRLLGAYESTARGGWLSYGIVHTSASAKCRVGDALEDTTCIAISLRQQRGW